MSFSKTNPAHIDTVIEAILAKFAGQTVHNKVLKEYLCKTLPDLFPSGRADGAVEYLADAAFRSTVTSSGVGGVAFLEGILEGNRRYWKVPMDTSNTIAKSDLPIENLSRVAPTRKVKMDFGTYVAAAKAKPKSEPTK